MIFILGSIVNMNEGVPTQLFNEHKNLHFEYDKIFICDPKNMSQIAI